MRAQRHVRAIGVLMAGWAACAPVGAMAQQGPPPAKVALDEVKLEQIEQWREVTGDLRAAKRSVLAAEQAGLVTDLLVNAGDHLDKGQVLAKLDDTLLRLAVDRAVAIQATRAAVVDQRQAELDKAQRDLASLTSLAEQGGAKQNEVADARTAVATAQARLAQARADESSAKADLSEARERLDDMTIRAPFVGHVVNKRTEVGQWLQAGDPVIEAVETDYVEAWLDVPEQFVDQLGKSDASVQVRVSALGEVRDAGVMAVIPAADTLSRTFPVRVRLENPDGRLKPGMSVVGLVPTGTKGESLTVSKDAVLRNDAGTYVYFAQKTPDGGMVSAVAPVEVQFAVGDRVAVRSTVLHGGMYVVVEGNERMFPGQPLMVLRGGPKAAEASGAGESDKGAG